MAERGGERVPRRDPGRPVPEQLPGEDNPPIEGTAEDFAPRTTTDVAQHAPGPHGQGDEPSSAVAGRYDYDDTPQVRETPGGGR